MWRVKLAHEFWVLLSSLDLQSTKFLMPSIHLLQLILFFLSLSTFSLEGLSWTWSGPLEEDYQKWLVWNAKNRQRRTLLGESEKNTSTHVVDDKLWNAERNQIRVSVNQNGSGDYRTIREALNSIPLHNTRRVILDIKPGVYREKIQIPKTKPFITFLGDSATPPTINGNDTASVTGRDGMPLKTFQSATVAVESDYFVAINIIFENSAPHQIGSAGEQAVAVRISGSKAAFYNCSFYGSQDTLYDHKGLHYFKNCFIQGSVDFIFGYGRSFYENCTLNSTAKKVASLTAQKRTNSSLWSGFSFKDCKVTGSGQVFLGRAWGDYSRVVFSYTFMDRLVLPEGWSNWGWGIQSRNFSVYYGEYKCSGPGANMTGRVKWARALTDQEVEPFLGTYYVDGDAWLLKTF